MPMTVADLIDYLGQFPPETRVVLSEDDIEEPCEFVALNVLDFADSGAEA